MVGPFNLGKVGLFGSRVSFFVLKVLVVLKILYSSGVADGVANGVAAASDGGAAASDGVANGVAAASGGRAAKSSRV